MRKEDSFYLGHISRPHGYKGEVIAVFDTDQAQKYSRLESVFVELHGELVPFFLEDITQNSKGHFIIRFEGFTTEEQAQEVVGRELFLPLDLLPPLEGKSFYFHEVIGFKMIDINHGELGKCTEVIVIDQSAQPLFQIQGKEIEVFVPAIDEFIVEIKREQQEIILDCPSGLVELYLPK